jgi:hypothetical protein
MSAVGSFGRGDVLAVHARGSTVSVDSHTVSSVRGSAP